MKIAKGVLVAISEGAYSDYGIIAAGRAKEDLDIDSLRDEWLVLHPDQNKQYGFKIYQFVKWLVVDKQMIEEVPIAEWHIGEYGTVHRQFSLNEDSFGLG